MILILCFCFSKLKATCLTHFDRYNKMTSCDGNGKCLFQCDCECYNEKTEEYNEICICGHREHKGYCPSNCCILSKCKNCTEKQPKWVLNCHNDMCINCDMETIKKPSKIDFLKEINDFMHKSYKPNIIKIQNKDMDGKHHYVDIAKFNSLTGIFPFELNNIYIEKSNVHGFGVFANRNISKGELITFYPGDVLEYTPNSDRYIHGHIVALYRSERFENKFGSTAKLGNDYAFTIDDKITIIGSNEFKDDLNYAGHFINDGAKPNINKDSYEIYNKISHLKANCIFYRLKENLHVAIVSNRNIVKGEELFLMYGIDYWKSIMKQ